MRKKQNKQELVEKRKVALELLDKDKSASEVAEIVSVTIRSIFRWQKQRENPPKKSEGVSCRESACAYVLFSDLCSRAQSG